MTGTTITAPETRRNARMGHDLSGITNIDDALTAAGLDWGLIMVDGNQPITILTPDGVINTTIPGQRFVMRDDNYVTMGMVKSKYEIVANRPVFSLGQHLLDQGAKLRDGGELDHGRRTFMRFDLPEATVNVGGVDLVTFGVSLIANHDGSGNVSARITAVRQVCTNGMTSTIQGIPDTFRIRHTASAQERLEEAGNILRGVSQYANGFAAAADLMFDVRFTRTEYAAYIDTLYPRPAETEKKAHTIWENRRAALLSLFSYAETNNIGRGSKWAAYNAVTEFNDWAAAVRVTAASGVKTVTEARTLRQFDDSNRAVKDRAFDLLTAV